MDVDWLESREGKFCKLKEEGEACVDWDESSEWDMLEPDWELDLEGRLGIGYTRR